MGGMEVKFHAALLIVLDGEHGQFHAPVTLSWGKSLLYVLNKELDTVVCRRILHRVAMVNTFAPGEWYPVHQSSSRLVVIEIVNGTTFWGLMNSFLEIF
jgi:hypothetical protein